MNTRLDISQEHASQHSDLVWSNGESRITLSPRNGGRITSWIHVGEERVHPVVLYEGGLFRVLFAEEQYPGASYYVPHQFLSWDSTAYGFRAHLRHYWNTSSWFMRAAGWNEKASELHVDGLLLDKVLSYNHERACLECELTLTNLTEETKYITPWIHSSLTPWPAQQRVVVNGEQQEYSDTEIYWGSHVVPPHAAAALVQGDASRTLFAVLGTATDHVRGLCGMLPVPGEFLQASCELRGATLELKAGAQFKANSFLCLTPDWRQVLSTPPIDLFSSIAPVDGVLPQPHLAELLEQWMLPEERERGLMVLSFLDKPPFYSDSRYAAAHSFAAFRPEGNRASAKVMLYASRDIAELRAQVIDGTGNWQLQFKEHAPATEIRLQLKAHEYSPLTLTGPGDLRNKEKVWVRLTFPGQASFELSIEATAGVEKPRPYQVRQAPAYMERRYRDKLGPAAGASRDEIIDWQRHMRTRLRQWLEFNAYGVCDLDPHLLERQSGPTCIREKWVVQTEPGIYVPGYLVRPINTSGRKPLIYFLHGSGPGKDGFAGDELENPQRTMFGHELENMPYALAQRLGCLVYVPDGRGQGEMGETDPGRWSARMNALGISNVALRLRDQIRALDWLVSRDDVDPNRIGSCGCSGGGNLTYMFAAADERVRASVVASTSSTLPVQEAPPGWFHRMLLEGGSRIEPYGIEPISGAPMGMLIAPRPMWIMDGIDDLGISDAERVEWRKSQQQGRDAIRRVYESLGAGEKLTDSWLEGGHCAGMTHEGVADWFANWL